MKDIVIVGASGFAREVQFVIERINQVTPAYNLIGFIDTALEVGSLINGIPVVGNDDFLLQYPTQLDVAMGIGSGKVREKLYHMLRENTNLSFPNLIDPSVICSESVSYGIGNIICAGSILTVNIQIKDFVILNLDCTVGHDATIDSFVTVSPSANLSGNVHINPLCYIGTSSCIIQGISIGQNTTIGAGAVVVKDIPENCTAVGTPAKPIKYTN